MSSTENAFAKLNITLRVKELREDGFNNIEAITLFCKDFVDILTVEHQINKGDELLTLNHKSTTDKDLILDDTNLILRAYNIFNSELEKKSIEPEPFIFEIEKHIPSRAGLGGGSADCAATLRILNSFYSNIFTINELIAMASILGSDIAGCVHSKALTMTGRGEKVKVFESDLNFLDEFQVLAITPNIFCSTPQVYQHYDDIHRPTHAGISSPEGFGLLSDNFHNDLEIAALDLDSELREFKEHIESLTNKKFMLAGSGSSIFVILKTQEAEYLKILLEDKLSNELIHEKIRQLCVSAIC